WSGVHSRLLLPGNFSPVDCDILSRSGRARKRRENYGRIQRLRAEGSFLRRGAALVEQADQEEPAEEAANMSFPCNSAFLTGNLHCADTEISVHHHPQDKERDDATVSQGLTK